MKRQKLYLTEFQDVYDTIDNIISHMKYNDMSEIKVSLGRVLRGTEYFFCRADQEIALRCNGCGKECLNYVPRNGKSGICENYGYVYEPVKYYMLKVNGELTELEETK